MLFFKHKKSKVALSEKEIKWNKLWEKYADGSLDPNYFILCDYHAGVNGGGHLCFFDNNEERLSDYAKALKKLLPAEFFIEFEKAYKAYIKGDESDEIYDRADDYFYENESTLIEILQNYANSL